MCCRSCKGLLLDLAPFVQVFLLNVVSVQLDVAYFANRQTMGALDLLITAGQFDGDGGGGVKSSGVMVRMLALASKRGDWQRGRASRTWEHQPWRGIGRREFVGDRIGKERWDGGIGSVTGGPAQDHGAGPRGG